MAAKPYIIALEEHYQDAEVRGLTVRQAPEDRRAASKSGSTISVACASRRWTRPASTSRCCRTRSPACKASTPRAARRWLAASTTGCTRRC